MSENKTSTNSGVGLLGLMFLIFLTLKLTGFISWSWWWVTAPLWAPFAVVLFVILPIFLVVEMSRSNKR